MNGIRFINKIKVYIKHDKINNATQSSIDDKVRFLWIFNL